MMSFITTLIAATALASTPATPIELINRIDTAAYSAEATFSVTMPQLTDDVVYALVLNQTPAPADTLCPAAYLIDWTVTHRPGMSEPTAADHGFTSYFSGNHYSLTAERLRERHMPADVATFTRPVKGGIAVTSQFADLVPALMAAKLRDMADDPRYSLSVRPDTIVGGEKAVVLLTRMTVNGNVASEGEYLFYPGATLTPRRVVLENNTGSIGEQTITVNIARPHDAGTTPAPVTEEALMAVYPDQFERYRTSSYRLENLPGRHLPAIAAPTSTGTRFARNTSQSLDAPTAVVMLEARSEFTPKVIAAVREAAAQLPWRMDILWAFTDTNPDDVEAVIAEPATDETILLSARAIARDCGAGSTLPAIVFAGRNGIVTDFIAGYNNSLSSDVLKKMMGMKP